MNVTFTKYVKLILPLDGYVFWVRADLLSPSALVGALQVGGSVTLDQAQSLAQAAASITIPGSLHYATDLRQDEGANSAINRVLFTSQTKVDTFNQAGVNAIYIAVFNDIEFAFSGRDYFMADTNTYHYVGTSIPSEMKPQIINAAAGFDASNIVSSNSVPLWLALNSYTPIYFDGIANPMIIYPSFVVPTNIPPPYAVVHVPPDSTRALQPTPFVDSQGNHWQLVAEKVRVTLWGTRNFTAMDFMDAIERYSVDYDTFGIMNAPVVRDEQKGQPELEALAMKKTIEFEISYYQTRVRAVARQLILSAIPTFYFQDGSGTAAVIGP